MADFGEILGAGIVGGLLGFAESKYNQIEDEEEKAREDGLIRLKREFQIEDDEWERRMKVEDAATKRREKLEDRSYADEKEQERRRYEDKFREENRRYDTERKAEEKEGLLGEKKEAAEEKRAREDAKDEEESKEKFEKEKFDYLSDKRVEYNDAMITFDDGSTKGSLFSKALPATNKKPVFETWIKSSDPEGYSRYFAGEESNASGGLDTDMQSALDGAMNSKNPRESVDKLIGGMAGDVQDAAMSYLKANYKK